MCLDVSGPTHIGRITRRAKGAPVQGPRPRLQLDVVAQQHLHHSLGGVRHKDLSPEVCLLREVWQRSAVVDVEVGDQDEVDFRWVVEGVEERKGIVSFTAWVRPAVKHNIAATKL